VPHVTERKQQIIRILAYAIALLAAAKQAIDIGSAWWDFDPRLSCDRLRQWSEWIVCLHGESHLYITSIEVAVGSWLLASLTYLLARSVSPYFSLLFPGLVAASLVAFLVQYWHDRFIPFIPLGEPSLWDLFQFAILTAELTASLVGPLAAGWLLGLYARAQRCAARSKDPRDLAEVF
jgi:hypothetical protein